MVHHQEEGTDKSEPIVQEMRLFPTEANLFIVRTVGGPKYFIKTSQGSLSATGLMELLHKASEDPKCPVIIKATLHNSGSFPIFQNHEFVNFLLTAPRLSLTLESRNGEAIYLATPSVYGEQLNFIPSEQNGLPGFRLNEEDQLELKFERQREFYIGGYGKQRFSRPLKKPPLLMSVAETSLIRSKVTLLPPLKAFDNRSVVTAVTSDPLVHRNRPGRMVEISDLRTLFSSLESTQVNGFRRLPSPRCLVQITTMSPDVNEEKTKTLFFSSLATKQFPANHAGNFQVTSEEFASTNPGQRVTAQLSQCFFPTMLSCPAKWELKEFRFELTQNEMDRLRDAIGVRPTEMDWKYTRKLPSWILARMRTDTPIVRPPPSEPMVRLPEILSVVNSRLRYVQIMMNPKSKATGLQVLPSLTTGNCYCLILAAPINFLRFLGTDTKSDVGEGWAYQVGCIDLKTEDQLAEWQSLKPLNTKCYLEYARPRAVEIRCDGLGGKATEILGIIPWTTKEDSLASGYQEYPLLPDLRPTFRLTFSLRDSTTQMPLTPYLRYTPALLEIRFTFSEEKLDGVRTRWCDESLSVLRVGEQENARPPHVSALRVRHRF